MPARINVKTIKGGFGKERSMASEESKKAEKALAEEIWLTYFNNYLYEHGVITETERNRMFGMILERKSRKASRTQANARNREQTYEQER